MIDLAYSALLFNSKEIAEEVLILEDYVDETFIKCQETLLNLAASSKEPIKYLSVLSLVTALENMADAARKIADIILQEIEPHPVYSIALAEAEEIIGRVYVDYGSPIDGKTLRQVKLQDKTGARVLIIRRDRQWIFNPTGDAVITGGDILIVRGPLRSEEALKKFITPVKTTTPQTNL